MGCNKRISIFADNYVQAMRYAGGPLPITINGVHYHYISTPESLIGLRETKIVYVGAWDNHPLSRQISDQITIMRKTGRIEEQYEEQDDTPN